MTILPPKFKDHVAPPGKPGDLILLLDFAQDEGCACDNCGNFAGEFFAWRVMADGSRAASWKWFMGHSLPVTGRLEIAYCPVCSGGKRQTQLIEKSGLRGVVLQSGLTALDCSLENFKERSGTEEALKVARRIAGDPFGGCRSLILVGGYGCGKTHLLCAMLNEIRKLGVYSRYSTAEGILADLRATFNKESRRRITEDVIAEYVNVTVLAIDELTRVQVESNWVSTNLFEIVNARLTSNCLTLFASNKPLDDFVVDPLSAIASRLRAGYVIEIEATDLRPVIGQRAR